MAAGAPVEVVGCIPVTARSGLGPWTWHQPLESQRPKDQKAEAAWLPVALSGFGLRFVRSCDVEVPA